MTKLNHFVALVLRRWAVSLLVSMAAMTTSQVRAQPEDDGAKSSAPVPLLEEGHPVNWWFVFKFNTATYPGCGDGPEAERSRPFGGKLQTYKFGQRFAYASSENKTLKLGGGCSGATSHDPLGATFGEIYNGSYYYVVWNDQFYEDPKIQGCGKSCAAPWGHSKGMLAWNETGEGVVLQVTTPSWPAAGSKAHARKTDGNTLGCISDDDVLVSQHFFALKLTKGDVVTVLKALQNASVVTDPSNLQIVNNGGPDDIQQLVAQLGKHSPSTALTAVTLSSGVELISKPSKLTVPPWQMVSSSLGGVSLRAATWWANPKINTTTASTKVSCWNSSLATKPGPIEIATTGDWEGHAIGLTGGPGADFNHAKIGVSTSGEHHYSIFGDMNQQGAIAKPDCGKSQNGRGGLFYVIDDESLNKSVAKLIAGKKAPTK